MLIWPLVLTVLVAVGALVLGGPGLLTTVVLLAIFEISISFDNAVVNATVLRRMSRFWQRMFLTLGILIAVVGVRLVLPLICLSAATGLPPQQASTLAAQDGEVAHRITEASAPVLMPFGAVYLLMIFLGFAFADRDVLWLGPVESVLQRIGRVPNLAILISLTLLLGIAAADDQHRVIILLSGLAGLAAYLLVSGAAQYFLVPDEGTEPATGPGPVAAIWLFLYLELLDASFSFDGVVGAFAISPDVRAIATGLGVGAVFVRSLTVRLVRKGMITEYVYLEHGAHWALGALAVTMLVRLHHHVNLNGSVTGLIGAGFIGAAFLSSLRARRYVPAHARRDRAFRVSRRPFGAPKGSLRPTSPAVQPGMPPRSDGPVG